MSLACVSYRAIIKYPMLIQAPHHFMKVAYIYINIHIYLDNMRRKTTMLFNLQDMFRLGTQTIIS